MDFVSFEVFGFVAVIQCKLKAIKDNVEIATA